MVSTNEADIRRAFEMGDLLVLKDLVGKGRYEVDVFNDAWRLQAAGENKFSEEVMVKFMQYLIVSGCGATTRSPLGDEQTLLHRACYPSLVDLYIDFGVEIDVLDAAGRTPLFCAVDNSRADVVRALLQHGADRDIMCGTSSPIGYARLMGRTECLNALLGSTVEGLNSLLKNDSLSETSYSW